jgi:hypothetical protein
MGQLASSSVNNLTASTFLINQKGSGNLLKVQKNGMHKFVINNDGVMKILATTTDVTDLIVVENKSEKVFTINSRGDLFAKGHITAGKDTAGTAIINPGDNQATVNFAYPYASAPKVVVTAQVLPDFVYGIINKTENGFTIVTNQPVGALTSFDWIALEAGSGESQSVSGQNLQVLVSPSSGGSASGSIIPNGTPHQSPVGSGSGTGQATASDYPDANDIPEGTQVGPSYSDPVPTLTEGEVGTPTPSGVGGITVEPIPVIDQPSAINPGPVIEPTSALPVSDASAPSTP